MCPIEATNTLGFDFKMLGEAEARILEVTFNPGGRRAGRCGRAWEAGPGAHEMCFL